MSTQADGPSPHESAPIFGTLPAEAQERAREALRAIQSSASDDELKAGISAVLAGDANVRSLFKNASMQRLLATTNRRFNDEMAAMSEEERERVKRRFHGEPAGDA